MSIVNCDNCGKSIERPPHKIKRNKHHFCSVECRAEGQKEYQKGEKHHNYNSVIVKCTYCAEPVKRAKGYAETYNNLFCNMECYGKWMSENLVGKKHPRWSRIKVLCKVCGEILYRQPNRIKRTKHHLCSRECTNEWNSISGIHAGPNNPRWKGGCNTGTVSYGPNWTRQKKVVRRRDNYICQYCSRSEKHRAHDVHHIIPFREFGIERYKEANQLRNLVTLCRKCHFKSEDGIISIQPYLI